MKSFKIWKSTAMAIAIISTFTLMSGISRGESINEVQARIDDSYQKGEIDRQTHDDLKGALDSAKTAANAQDYASATEAYNLLAPHDLSANFSGFGN